LAHSEKYFIEEEKLKQYLTRSESCTEERRTQSSDHFHRKSDRLTFYELIVPMMSDRKTTNGSGTQTQTELNHRERQHDLEGS
jgi:hypothetical protein